MAAKTLLLMFALGLSACVTPPPDSDEKAVAAAAEAAARSRASSNAAPEGRTESDPQEENVAATCRDSAVGSRVEACGETGAQEAGGRSLLHD